MRLYIPFRSLKASADWLPDAGLVEQILDAYRIAILLLRADADAGPMTRFRDCDEVQMWTGHRFALVEFGRMMGVEWRRRGYESPTLGFFNNQVRELTGRGFRLKLPAWLGEPRLHVSHQSAMLRRYPNEMHKWAPETPDTLPTLWPRWLNNERRGFTLHADAADAPLMVDNPDCEPRSGKVRTAWLAALSRRFDPSMPRAVRDWEARTPC